MRNGADQSEDDGYPFTAPVGSYPDGASPYGVLDMAGNVWERVADWYSDTYYASAPARNPTGAVIRRLRRDTGRLLEPLQPDTSGRLPVYKYLQGNRSSGLGFRCVLYHAYHFRVGVCSLIAGRPVRRPTTCQHMPTALLPRAYSLEETSMQDFAITDFGAVHAPVNGDANEHLDLWQCAGCRRPRRRSLLPTWPAFLGRWEGYSYGPPVKKDWKFVLVVQEITARGGKAFFWVGHQSPVSRLGQGDPIQSCSGGYAFNRMGICY